MPHTRKEFRFHNRVSEILDYLDDLNADGSLEYREYYKIWDMVNALSPA